MLIGSLWSSGSKFNFSSKKRCTQVLQEVQFHPWENTIPPWSEGKWGRCRQDGAHLVENCTFAMASIIIITLQSFRGSSLSYVLSRTLQLCTLQGSLLRTNTGKDCFTGIVVGSIMDLLHHHSCLKRGERKPATAWWRASCCLSGVHIWMKCLIIRSRTWFPAQTVVELCPLSDVLHLGFIVRKWDPMWVCVVVHLYISSMTLLSHMSPLTAWLCRRFSLCDPV